MLDNDATLRTVFVFTKNYLSLRKYFRLKRDKRECDA